MVKEAWYAWVTTNRFGELEQRNKNYKNGLEKLKNVLERIMLFRRFGEMSFKGDIQKEFWIGNNKNNREIMGRKKFGELRSNFPKRIEKAPIAWVYMHFACKNEGRGRNQLCAKNRQEGAMLMGVIDKYSNVWYSL